MKMYFLLKMGDIPASHVSLPEGHVQGLFQKIEAPRPVVLFTLITFRL